MLALSREMGDIEGLLASTNKVGRIRLARAARVLVVEDERMVREAYELLLRSEGVVDGVSTVDEAMGLLSLRQYTAVVCDLLLTDAQGRDGVWVLERVGKTQPAARRVLLTGASTPQVAERLGRHGCIDCLLFKPAGKDQLLEAILGPREG